MTDTTARERLNNRMDELRQMRDEIKLQLHLGQLELKDKWNKDLEPRLSKLEREASEDGESVRDATLTLADELGVALKKFSKSLGI